MTGMEIRETRKNILKWSMEKLAREIGVALCTVYNWETGKSRPSNLAMDRIQKVFGEAQKSLNSQRGRDNRYGNIIARTTKEKITSFHPENP